MNNWEVCGVDLDHNRINQIGGRRNVGIWFVDRSVKPLNSLYVDPDQEIPKFLLEVFEGWCARLQPYNKRGQS